MVLKVERHSEGSITVLLLDRPKSLNALSCTLMSKLEEELLNAEKNGSKVVIIASSSPRAFCAGKDVKDMNMDANKIANSLIETMESLSIPVIAAVNGACFTGGLEVILGCDIIVADSEKAYFADTHAKLGLVPTWGEPVRLPKKIGINNAKLLIYTCDRLSPQEAKELGLVQKLTSPGQSVQDLALEIGERICRNNQESIRKQKKMINRGWKSTEAEALAFFKEFHPGHARGANITNAVSKSKL